MPQEAINALLDAIASNAGEKEDEFFNMIRPTLNTLCERIAGEVHADSAVVFFETEDNLPGCPPYMVMRGASGRLHRIYQKYAEKWLNGESDADGWNGFAYPSRLTPEILDLDHHKRQKVMRNWSVTNQIWHLAEGRLANSNRAMDELHGGSNREGRGDSHAYRGDNLHTTFRTMIGVPIYAQGKSYAEDMATRTTLSQPDGPDKGGYPLSASPSAEFHSKYRVIGILKVENKQPLHEGRLDVKTVKAMLTRRLQQEKIPPPTSKRDLDRWLRSVCKNPDAMWQAFSTEGAHCFSHLTTQGEKPLKFRKAITDVLTEYCQAQFTRQDMELLVLLAMQLGRLISHRIIKHAADNDIIINENEIGLLNIQWRDIDHLVALRHAAEVAARKTAYHLEALKARMDMEKRQDVFHARVSELLDPRGPIRDITTRTKEYISLIRKLVRKQHALEDSPYVDRIAFTDLSLTMDNYSYRSGKRCFARGTAQFSLDLAQGNADLKMGLGVQGAPQIHVDETDLLIAVERSAPPAMFDSVEPGPILPLVYRILAPGIYGVDDLAGIRVISDYDSGVDDIIAALQAHAEEWNIEIGKIDDLREGKEGGYRAVHITIHVNVESLLKPEHAQKLDQALKLVEGESWKMPVEIQLKTAYQHSWALKVHHILYKQEERIAQELRDEQEILSNVLAEADGLSDIVRNSIENMLLPTDYGERHLLAHLKRRLHPEDLNIVKFGIACAKEVLRDKLRYNGQPEFTFAIEVCTYLVHRFQVVDSTLLLTALLYNVWRIGHSDRTRLLSEPMLGKEGDDMTSLLCERLELACGSSLRRYYSRLPLPSQELTSSDRLRSWMTNLPAWFWGIQQCFREFFLQPREELTRLRHERLQSIFRELRRRHREGDWGPENLDEWFERAYMLEAAILLADLSDLPDEPGSVRRRRLYSDYLSLFREIRRYFPNSPSKTLVIEELDHAFQEMETRLDLYRDPDWWGE